MNEVHSMNTTMPMQFLIYLPLSWNHVHFLLLIKSVELLHEFIKHIRSEVGGMIGEIGVDAVWPATYGGRQMKRKKEEEYWALCLFTCTPVSRFGRFSRAIVKAQTSDPQRCESLCVRKQPIPISQIILIFAWGSSRLEKMLSEGKGGGV